jgi:hypothetical protein
LKNCIFLWMNTINTIIRNTIVGTLYLLHHANKTN